MDPREVLEHEYEVALDEAKARIRAAVDDATRDVLAEIGASARGELRAATGAADTAERVTRSDAARLFGVTMSKMRSLEQRGLVHPRRRGGRIMVDPEEVAQALGVPVPGKAPNVEEALKRK